eukprot:2125390-Ditylum_brightwellii.AAC.1
MMKGKAVAKPRHLIIGVAVIVMACASYSSLVLGKSLSKQSKHCSRDKVLDANNEDEPVEEELTCLTLGDTGGGPDLDLVKNRKQPSRDSDECLLNIPPDPYMKIVLDVLVGFPNAGSCNFSTGCKPPHVPYDKMKRQYGLDWPPYGFTMTGKERLNNFRAAINEVNRNKIEGAIAEFGVWRGGAMIMAAAVQKHDDTALDRDLYLFDAFQSFGGYGKSEDYLAVSIEQVKSNFESFGLLHNDKLHFIKGLFQDTVKDWVDRDDTIAVLRVDGNFYESYQDVLYAVFMNVPVGGIVIFDDVMSHKDVMECWIDFKSDHGIPEELVQIDFHSAWFRKTNDTHIDQSKKRKTANLKKEG